MLIQNTVYEFCDLHELYDTKLYGLKPSSTIYCPYPQFIFVPTPTLTSFHTNSQLAYTTNYFIHYYRGAGKSLA